MEIFSLLIMYVKSDDLAQKGRGVGTVTFPNQLDGHKRYSIFKHMNKTDSTTGEGFCCDLFG